MASGLNRDVIRNVAVVMLVPSVAEIVISGAVAAVFGAVIFGNEPGASTVTTPVVGLIAKA